MGPRRTRDRWKPLTGVDERGFIVAYRLTKIRVDDAGVVGELLSQIGGEVERFTADGAHDKTAVYEALVERDAKITVPPTKKPGSQRRTRAQRVNETRP